MIKLSVRQMQAIDRYAGSALCAVYSVMSKLHRALFPVRLQPGGEVRSIAILKFWGMGSIIVAVPSFRKLREKYPNAKIIFVTFSRNKEVCEFLSISDKVIAITVDRGVIRLAQDLLRLIIELRRHKADILYDLEFFTRFSALICYLSGARRSYGFYSPQVWRGWIHTDKVQFDERRHMRDNMSALLGVDGMRENAEDVQKLISAAGREYVSKMLASERVGKNACFCVNVNAAVEFGWERRWAAERFAELADRIIEAYGLYAVFTGSPGERAYAENVRLMCRRRDRTLNIAGRLSIEQYAALLQGSALMITNDTGPLHLAAFVGTPTVSFFGSDTPALYGPRGANNIVFFKAIDCSPCVSITLSKMIRCVKGRPLCLEMISVDEVFDSILRSGILSAGRQA